MRLKVVNSGLVILIVLALLACSKKVTPAPAPEPYVHTIQYSGETLALISTWYTGSRNNWEKIKAENPGLNERRLRIGDQVRIPVELMTKNEPLPKNLIPEVQVAKQDEPVVAMQDKLAVVPAASENSEIVKLPEQEQAGDAPLFLEEEVGIVEPAQVEPPASESKVDEAEPIGADGRASLRTDSMGSTERQSSSESQSTEKQADSLWETALEISENSSKAESAK